MIRFTIPGAPVGKGRARSVTRNKAGGGTFIAHVTPEKTACYENLVRIRAHAQVIGVPPIEGPVGMTLRIFVTPPESWSAKKKADALAALVLPTTKPDTDNILKAIADACNNIVYYDDKQITDVSIRKRYDTIARVEVEIEKL